MDTRLSLEVVQCRQFDPVSGPFSMNNERKDETPSVYTIGSQRNLVPIRSRQAYFKRRSQIPNVLVIILFCLIASLFVVVLVLSVLYALSKQLNICDSENCVRIAASLKESMDTSVDPCDDFYKYTCGNWPQEHPIPDNSLTNSWFDERRERVSKTIRQLLRKNITSENAPRAVEQAKILYTSCMDADAMDELGLTPLFKLLEELSLPPIPAAFTKNRINYIEQLARVKRVLGKDVFFGLDVIIDPRNKSKNVIYLDVPVTSSPLPNDKRLEKRLQLVKSRLRKLDGEMEDEDTSDLVDAELTYMTEVIKQIVSNGTVDECSLKQESQFPYQKELKEVVATLHNISNAVYFLSYSASNRSNVEDDIVDTDYMLIDDLQKITDEYITETNSSLTPKLLWRPFIELLYKDIATLDLNGKEKVLIGDLDYLKDVALTISQIDEEDLETYIWWVVVDTAAPHSSENIRKVWTEYIDQLIDVEIGEPKSLHCTSAVNELMGMAVSWLFVDPSFHENKGRNVLEMLEDIRGAFASLVAKTDWMDKRTKTATLEKNRKMASEIGFPTWLFDEDILNEYYRDIDLSETEYLGNMVKVVQCMSLWQLECVTDINYSNETYWATDPTDVNAFHTFQVNQITIPAGILQFPFYELGIEALNYGAIGTVLGHELTHGFDNSGRHYDSDGNMRQWWSNQTISEYNDRTECFIKHYNGYYVVEVDDYIDGELTLGENIADNGGLREAVIAYERWKARHGQEPLLPGFTHLTHEQLFFLAFAHLWCESYTPESVKWMLLDSHCPGHVRLQAVLKNSKEFSETWKCPVGSNMNPAEKCHLW